MQIHFEFAYFSFFPYSFGIETINTLIHSIPNSRPKWAKCMSVSDQNGAKTLSDRGDTYLYGLYKGIPHHPLSPAPPPPPGLKHSAVSITIHICNNKSSVYVQYIIRSLTTKGSGKNVQEFQVSCIKSSDGTMEMKSFCFTVFNIALFVF